ncbi:hypothetical protein [Rhizorhabdus wittichii]|uniref:hypothetical protein n=1 Tax=Rhizorhabdus wittichii TaxID=160791 RepID=UPI00178C665A|nr:hypothetical protein [Rhizorhabdus wittichii]
MHQINRSRSLLAAISESADVSICLDIAPETKRAAHAALSIDSLMAPALRAVAATTARGRHGDARRSRDTGDRTSDTETARDTCAGGASTRGARSGSTSPSSARTGTSASTRALNLGQLDSILARDLLVEAHDNAGPHLRANRLRGSTAQRGSGFWNSRSNGSRDQRSNRKRRSNLTKAFHNGLLTRSNFP